MEMQNTSVVMTGATSFVGSESLKKLLEAGCRVTAVVRPGSANLDKLNISDKILSSRLNVVELDLSELDRLPEVLTGERKEDRRCDVFLHFGWGGSGSDARKDAALQNRNVENSLKAVRAAAALGCRRFIFSGSQAEYGFHKEVITEETPCFPASEYGRAKLEVGVKASAVCRELQMDYGHVRIFSAYGPGDHPWSLVSDCIRTFKAGGEMRMGSCDQFWNFLYIEDLAQAVVRLALCGEPLMGAGEPEGYVYNLAGGPEDTGILRDFVEEIYELCGRKGTCVFGVRPPNAEGVVSLRPDISKIQKATGWRPYVRFAHGIRKILANT